MELEQLLQFAYDMNASDLHLSTGSYPMVRVNGSMRKLNLPIIDDDTMQRFAREVMNEFQLEKFELNREIDFSTRLKEFARFRVNFFHQINGLSAVFRVIPSDILTFDELGLPDVLKSLALKDRGLVLFVGPTGCGKSTSLATMIDYINEYKHKHIITIEDPIEYYHSSKSCLVNQREIGSDTLSFANALRVALREDPDVILVGEMRDLETISLALTAAETGHLVLATLHTSSASKTIDRIIDIFPAGQKSQVRSMLSESLEAVVAQKLLATKDGKGRAPAMEIMVANTAVRNLIREDKVYQIPSVIQSSGKEGMQTLDQDLQKLVNEGKIDRPAAAEIADNPKLFQVHI